jgi:hypothetical protein
MRVPMSATALRWQQLLEPVLAVVAVSVSPLPPLPGRGPG